MVKTHKQMKLDKNNFREERPVLAPGSRLLPITAAKSVRQGLSEQEQTEMKAPRLPTTRMLAF